jgi:hypothetical protein
LKRQQRRREQPAVRVAKAAVAKSKRERRKREKAAPFEPTESIVPTESPAAERASLRSTKNSDPICDRVGCHKPQPVKIITSATEHQPRTSLRA